VERQEKEVHDEHLYEELKRLRKENAHIPPDLVVMPCPLHDWLEI
jgi:hypothetical protein